MAITNISLLSISHAAFDKKKKHGRIVFFFFVFSFFRVNMSARNPLGLDASYSRGGEILEHDQAHSKSAHWCECFCETTRDFFF